MLTGKERSLATKHYDKQSPGWLIAVLLTIARVWRLDASTVFQIFEHTNHDVRSLFDELKRGTRESNPKRSKGS